MPPPETSQPDAAPETGRKMVLAVFLACTPCAIGGVAAILGGIGVAMTWKGVVGLSAAAILVVVGILWVRRRSTCPA